VRSPDGIGDWPRRRFRQWVGVRVESHSEQLARLEKAVAAQNKLVLDLRRQVEILTPRVDLLTRPSSTDYAARLGEMASSDATGSDL